MTILAHIRDDNGKLPSYAWPGGYPIVYITGDGGVFCPDCANSEPQCTDPESGSDWLIVTHEIYYEGPVIFCDNCNGTIDSAYGDPDEDLIGEDQ